MDKLKMQPDSEVYKNIQKLRTLFPSLVSEVMRGGESMLAVDFDAFRQMMTGAISDEGEERYAFTWPNKKSARLLAYTPVRAALRPCREESVDFDGTENLYIEGDNLDVLKLLRETYLGAVKLIYIDPPYNTGNDFIYDDDFAEDACEYLSGSGQYDDMGNRLVQNKDTNGRFHTDWLNMMYPRLTVAKDLLRDDGVIFISINDREHDNLKKMCDEIFGPTNFVATCIRRKNKLVMKGNKTFKNVLEPLLVYAKNRRCVTFSYTQASKVESDFSVVAAKYKEHTVHFDAGMLTFRDESASVKKGTYGAIEVLNDFVVAGHANADGVSIRGHFKWSRSKIVEKLAGGAKIFIKDASKMVPRIYFMTDTARPLDYIDEKYGRVTNEDGLADLDALGMGEFFDYPKPVDFVKFICNIVSDDSALVMDFFSGSATTAHAVMQLNAEDGGERRFIMVQLPEECGEDGRARAAGLNSICEIGKERIRRAGDMIAAATGADIDRGFRVLKLSDSNMKDVYYKPAMYDKSLLDSLTDNIKPDRTPLDLLFQVMLELGIPLSARIEETTVAGKRVFAVGGNRLIACFDSDVTDEVVTAIAKLSPAHAVFRDSSLASDSVGANFDQIFATYSPNTKRAVL